MREMQSFHLGNAVDQHCSIGVLSLGLETAFYLQFLRFNSTLKSVFLVQSGD